MQSNERVREPIVGYWEVAISIIVRSYAASFLVEPDISAFLGKVFQNFFGAGLRRPEANLLTPESDLNAYLAAAMMDYDVSVSRYEERGKVKVITVFRARSRVI